MQLAEATKLKGVVSTRSPSPTPAASMQRWSPAVPLLTPTACRAPTRAARLRSKRSSCGPMLRMGVRRTFCTAARSASVTSGSHMGILMVASIEWPADGRVSPSEPDDVPAVDPAERVAGVDHLGDARHHRRIIELLMIGEDHGAVDVAQVPVPHRQRVEAGSP